MLKANQPSLSDDEEQYRICRVLESIADEKFSFLTCIMFSHKLCWLINLSLRIMVLKILIGVLCVCEKSSKVIIFLQSLSMGRCSSFQVISKEADSQNRKSLLILRKIFHVVGGLRDSV